MSYIDKAFYGDEKSRKDVTGILADKIQGNTIDVAVNEQLIPPFTVAPKTEITNLEAKKIREHAVKSCGGVDQACIEAKEASLRQEALAAKERAANSATGVIKGRRLTVEIINAKGDRERLVIPDGQQFKLDGISITDPRKGPLEIPPLKYFQGQLQVLGALVLGAFIYAFSVIATYTVFHPMGIFVWGPAVTLAVFVPYSGYVAIFLYFMFLSAANTYVRLSNPSAA